MISDSSSSVNQIQVEMETDLPVIMDMNMDLYQPTYNWFCCTHYKDRSKFQNLLINIDLSPIQKQIIRLRYINILENLQKRVRNYGILFYLGHIIITVGSLFVPALLSIQNSDKSYVYQNSNFSIYIYWSTFVLSLCVTIFNGILTLFKIDKKYYFLNTTLERFRTEGWQYFSLTGRYAGDLLKRKRKDMSIKPTYRNQFIFFMHYIERFKMKQVEEEYYKTDERITNPPNQANAASSANSFNTIPTTQSSFSPTSGTLIELQKCIVPQPIQTTVDSIQTPVNGIVQSHTTQPVSSNEAYNSEEEESSEMDEESEDEQLMAIPVEEENVIIIPSNNNPLFEEKSKIEETSTLSEENPSH